MSSRKQDSEIKTGYYGYSSESSAIRGGNGDGRRRNPGNAKRNAQRRDSSKLRKSAVIGMIFALVQLALSVGFIWVLVFYRADITKDILGTLLLPVVAAILAVLIALLAIVFAMEGRGKLGTKRFGKVLSAIISIILALCIYVLVFFPEGLSAGTKVDDDPFVVLISATDTFGDLSKKENLRSDTNILAAVHPKNHEIMMISIPRDYYIPMVGKSIAPAQAGSYASYDKLTHAGLYGTGTAFNKNTGQEVGPQDWNYAQEVSWDVGKKTIKKSLKNIFKFKVDSKHYHCVQINFTGFAKLIDALGGVTVDVDRSFSATTYANYNKDDGSRKTYKYTKGQMTMDGNEALTFARERHSFGEGDMARNKHQVKVMEALLEPATVAKGIANYGKVTDAVGKTFDTDVSITSMMGLQTKYGDKKWKIMSFNVIGEPNRMICTWNGQSLSVTMQDPDSIARGTKLLNMVLNGKNSSAVKRQIEKYKNQQKGSY